jgi:hypothetical protein
VSSCRLALLKSPGFFQRFFFPLFCSATQNLSVMDGFQQPNLNCREHEELLESWRQAAQRSEWSLGVAAFCLFLSLFCNLVQWNHARARDTGHGRPPSPGLPLTTWFWSAEPGDGIREPDPQPPSYQDTMLMEHRQLEAPPADGSGSANIYGPVP